MQVIPQKTAIICCKNDVVPAIQEFFSGMPWIKIKFRICRTDIVKVLSEDNLLYITKMLSFYLLKRNLGSAIYCKI